MTSPRNVVLQLVVGSLLAIAIMQVSADGASAWRASPLQLSTSLQVQDVAQAAPETGSASGAGTSESSSYTIGTGDGVTVIVYDEPDLSVKGIRVKGDGRISMPLIGELIVRGLTSQELESLVANRLRDGYLKNPSVNVSIETYRLFYIKGEVRNPGGYDYVEGLTVEKAVALAGGYTERASENEVTVVRETDPEKRAYEAKPGTLIKPGDVITIGESFF